MLEINKLNSDIPSWLDEIASTTILESLSKLTLVKPLCNISPIVSFIAMACPSKVLSLTCYDQVRTIPNLLPLLRH
jgi:hypothetical protein